MSCRWSVCLALLAVSVFGQSPLRFEVATVKLAAPDATVSGAVPNGPGRMAFQNMTLRSLIYYAYGNGLSTALNVSGGPDWMNKNRYRIVGQAPAGPRNPTPLQFRAMLRTLLEERFALKSRTGSRTIDVYALGVVRSDGKLGPRVEVWDGTCRGGKTPDEDDPKTPRCAALLRPPGMHLEGVTMFAVAEMLSLPQPGLGRIVEDQTGLTGRYTMDLEFDFNAARGPEYAGASIFTAVREQWGLKLEAAKGALQTLVVESAELPTEN